MKGVNKPFGRNPEKSLPNGELRVPGNSSNPN